MKHQVALAVEPTECARGVLLNTLQDFPRVRQEIGHSNNSRTIRQAGGPVVDATIAKHLRDYHTAVAILRQPSQSPFRRRSGFRQQVRQQSQVRARKGAGDKHRQPICGSHALVGFA